MTKHCVREITAFAAVDAANWWLDKVNSRTVMTWVGYDPTHQRRHAVDHRPVFGDTDLDAAPHREHVDHRFTVDRRVA